MKEKSYDQELLYESVKIVTKKLSPNTEYSFNDLKNMAIKMPQFNNMDLSINEQREVGRRYSSWVKKCPQANVIIINRKSNRNLIYRKVSTNNISTPSKGGVR
ncbi:cassette chromosome ssDNA-binding protein [Staphylococcus pettenkoferi]|uniref:cassette chromosome ssDNA-binding protein n=1 Tax=Staphylococcus pettenkoferi TaxID=170573 RepID=UPI0011A51960|nr:hypothetical protein [Staphylococcus pettenkoferi]MCY1591099.1 hypothetical protein [Staphylococcus pettenkoferi]MCY1591376.1 hypothetical protein [Staphylococcus pettenkoferi]MCY1597355.1 hypothetical protein [Staphylococcus pettenkoferi]MCY1598417.1 hypothetical protein [Staphylococcus pettenkoferi]MCY1601044.1 hypothetical protein [Staphylococcus pettenkoferi]